MNAIRMTLARAVNVAVAAIGGVLVAACQAPQPVVTPVAAPTEPVPARPKIREEIILLPSPEGRQTAIAVGVGAQEVLLDQAYAAASIATGDPIGRRTATAEEVQAIAGDALQALPMKPVSFMLYFDLDSDRLQPASEAQIQRIVEEIARRQVPDVSIIGHTDRSGKSDYNQKLSTRRAEQVQKLLIDRGARGIIDVAGKGESENVVEQKKRAPEQRNRRVEVVIR